MTSKNKTSTVDGHLMDTILAIVQLGEGPPRAREAVAWTPRGSCRLRRPPPPLRRLFETWDFGERAQGWFARPYWGKLLSRLKKVIFGNRDPAEINGVVQKDRGRSS